MEFWKVFRDSDTGRELCAYSVRGTFDGEEESTKALLSFECSIPVEQIAVMIEKRRTT